MKLRKAVDEMCKSCIYDSTEKGTWRHQVSLCDIKSCPLWEVRATPTHPIASKSKPED